MQKDTEMQQNTTEEAARSYARMAERAKKAKREVWASELNRRELVRSKEAIKRRRTELEAQGQSDFDRRLGEFLEARVNHLCQTGLLHAKSARVVFSERGRPEQSSNGYGKIQLTGPGQRCAHAWVATWPDSNRFDFAVRIRLRFALWLGGEAAFHEMRWVQIAPRVEEIDEEVAPRDQLGLENNEPPPMPSGLAAMLETREVAAEAVPGKQSTAGPSRL